MDLAKKNLPASVTVDGREYRIKTDFRWWLSFARAAKNTENIFEFDIFYDGMAPDDRLAGFLALSEFYADKEPLPRETSAGTEERAFDWNQDASRVFAAFWEQYGIDLFEADLHWHKFLALFRGLHGTKLNEVMGYRLWEKDGKSYDDTMKDLKQAWRLETELTHEEKKVLDEFNSEFE